MSQLCRYPNCHRSADYVYIADGVERGLCSGHKRWKPKTADKPALDLDGLEAAAKAANQESWSYYDGEVFASEIGSVALTYGPKATESDPNGKFIAALDPPTALALIDAARREEALRTALQAMVKLFAPEELMESGWPARLECRCCRAALREYGVRMSNGLYDNSAYTTNPHRYGCPVLAAERALKGGAE